MSPTREAYVRVGKKRFADGIVLVQDIECHVGVEFLGEDTFAEMASDLEADIETALRESVSHTDLVLRMEELILRRWPDRAYFVETDQWGKGLQVYQPFGMPRNDR